MVFEVRLAHKYGGIQWLDPDNAYTSCTAHPNRMLFKKKHGNNTYYVLACKDTYDYDIEDPELQDAEWDVWGHEEILYNEICEFYADSRTVLCYRKGEGYDSEEE